ncbi:hypothetical protein E7744_03260 [Citricoccus sp. SGAir0253]|uniref:hypothetical protein n=1 Tax=Citricoccus sp. SGAir0253 TaxID=2567881 RepID=UPI0010CD15CA|nr:hypothetical protein [Citricoccus sp. SGAir0253]QCU77343.1 hypothetical protein E7744_03260 [Citricoccus sp. SGAir0253]
MSTAPHPGPSTRWDLGFLVSVLVILLGSVLPLSALRQNLWNTPGLFFLGVGVLAPLVAAGLVLARIAARGAGPRVGSLGTEQFAHVASWLALAFFFLSVATSLNPVFLVGLLGALGMVATSPLRALVARALHSAATRRSRPTAVGSPTPAPAGTARTEPEASTTAAGGPHVPGTLRAEPAEAEPADRERATADEPVRATRPHPAVAGREYGDTAHAEPTGTEPGDAGWTDAEPADARAAAEPSGPAPAAHGSVAATAAAPETTAGGPVPEQVHEAFWFAVGTRRTTVDPEDGSPAFPLEPGAWILALEDRGDEFLVQDTDGRTAVLRDLSDIERA